MIDAKLRIHKGIDEFIASHSVDKRIPWETMKWRTKTKSRRWPTFVDAAMFHPTLRKSGESRSPWRVVGNASELFRDTTAPNRVVAGQLIKVTIDANVLNRQQAIGATNIEILTVRRVDDTAFGQITIRIVRAGVDRLLENGIRGGIPTVLEVGMAGVSYIVTSRQDKGAVVVFEIAGLGDLLDEDGHKPDGMGGRAGASFPHAHRVRDMVPVVGTRNVLAIPARREEDLDANPFGAVALGEFLCFWDGGLVEAEAMEAECLVRGIRAHRAPARRAGDHAETLGELLNGFFVATVQVVDGPVGMDELELAGVFVLVVERWSPIVGLVVLGIDARASAFAELVVIVGSSKVVAADYIVNMLVRIGGRL